MNTQTDKGFFRKFFTLKTSGQIANAEMAASVRAAKLTAPHGMRGFIHREQQRIDELVATTESFLADIESHFGDYVKYLGHEYEGKPRYENVEKKTRRRFAIKWMRRTIDDDLVVMVAFVYTETPDGNVRIDYVFELGEANEEVINDNYTGDNDIYKVQCRVHDTFRAVRRYKDHAEFLKKGTLPDWFKGKLVHYVQPI